MVDCKSCDDREEYDVREQASNSDVEHHDSDLLSKLAKMLSASVTGMSRCITMDEIHQQPEHKASARVPPLCLSSDSLRDAELREVRKRLAALSAPD